MQKANRLVEKYLNDMIDDLKELIEINSVVTKIDLSSDKPFGEGVSSGFKYMELKAREAGFLTSNFENMVLDISNKKKNKEYVGIVTHMDVVPAKREGWIKDPFFAWNDYKSIYGRGSQDNKASIIACFYAMKIIKELKIETKKEVRLIIGGNEEKTKEGINSYYKQNPFPTSGFTPDGSFPVARIELGHFHGLTTIRKPKGIISIDAGIAINVVASVATIEVKKTKDFKRKYHEFLLKNKIDGKIIEKCDSVVYKLRGKGAHGSLPGKGINALTYLLTFIDSICPNKLSSFIKNKFYEKMNGEGFGLKIEDSIAETLGQTTGGINMIKQTGKNITLYHDFRTPPRITHNQLLASLKNGFEEYFDVIKYDWNNQIDPIEMNENSSIIKALKSAYKSVIGKDGGTRINKSGSYAKNVKNIVVFGPISKDSETKFHEPNESILIEDFKNATKIYIQAILNLAKL